MVTRPEAEKAVVSRLKPVLMALGWSVAVDGTNPDLNEPLAGALGVFGVRPASRSAVSDADIGRLDDSLEEIFLLQVAVRVVESATFFAAARPQYERWVTYEVQWGTTSVTVSLQALIQMLRDELAMLQRAGQGIRVGVTDQGVRHKMRTGGFFDRRREERAELRDH